MKPLVVLEPLRCDYRWASDRLHGFVIDGMRANAREYRKAGVTYYPYVEPRPGAGSGLLEAFSSRAAVVITDDFPCFFLPRMVEAASQRVEVLLESVDSNGLLPQRSTDRAYPTAYAFRRHLQRVLPEYLGAFPSPTPLAEVAHVGSPWAPRTNWQERWPSAALEEESARLVSRLPIDHTVGIVGTPGGSTAGAEALALFVSHVLDSYAEKRNHPDLDATSHLSPYLHFGHVSPHQAFEALAERFTWSPLDLAPTTSGSRSGWWGMPESAEAFLDQIVTWRELGYNMCVHRPDYDQYDSLPDWARQTLGAHAGDPRQHQYSLSAFEQAHTHAELWNAAQTQLVRDGAMHNYLRMVWGKKILEWSPSPSEALDVMIELNNKYALDGRNPNSYSGIFWTLGRYDRPWGPERPIFGKIRFMSLANTRRKVNVREYLQRYGSDQGQLDLE